MDYKGASGMPVWACARNRLTDPFRRLMNYAGSAPLVVLAFLAIFALAVSSRLLVSSMFGSLQYDEGEHVLGGVFVSKFLLNKLNDPASYLARYPRTLDSFWFYPPLYSLLAAAAFSLFGYTEFVARLPSLAFSVLLVHATIRLAQETEQDVRVALVSGFFIGVSSIIVIAGSGAMVDVPLTAMVMYCILFWIRGVRNAESREFLKAGLMGGLACLMKPIGVGVLGFMVVFQVLSYLRSRDRTISSRAFWKGIAIGFSVFSLWWVSGLIAGFAAGGWIADAALNGLRYWFDFSQIFGGYVPPWYSPPWYTLGGWSYYGYHLVFIMGALPFLLMFVGIGPRLLQMKRLDFLLLLFALGVYVLQSFASNKNPRYIIPALPILYVFSGIGIVSLYTRVSKLTGKLCVPRARRVVASFLVLLVLLGGFAPLLVAVENRYTPGMGFGFSAPYQEVLQIIRDDRSGGIIVPDVQQNIFNVPVLTYYTASADNEGKYGCWWPPSNATEILALGSVDKNVQFVLVYDPTSDIGRFVSSHPDSFVLIGKAESPDETILVYRVVRSGYE